MHSELSHSSLPKFTTLCAFVMTGGMFWSGCASGVDLGFGVVEVGDDLQGTCDASYTCTESITVRSRDVAACSDRNDTNNYDCARLEPSLRKCYIIGVNGGPLTCSLGEVSHDVHNESTCCQEVTDDLVEMYNEDTEDLTDDDLVEFNENLLAEQLESCCGVGPDAVTASDVLDALEEDLGKSCPGVKSARLVSCEREGDAGEVTLIPEDSEDSCTIATVVSGS